MKRRYWLGGAVLALSSAFVMAQESPESLLPPGFDDPAPAPAPRRNAPVATTPAARQPAPASAPSGSPPVAAAPSQSTAISSGLAKRLPTIEELEAMSPDDLDEVLGLKPKDDIPPAARRTMSRVGILDHKEGGFPSGAFAAQPASLVRGALAGMDGPLVSRWGHIMLRRLLASRLDAPQGMDPAEFAALRASLLVRMGEGNVARALVQDVDTGNYTPAMVDAAFDAYVASGDILGICPVARINGKVRKDPQWELARQICGAFSGEASRANSELNKALSRGAAPKIDILLAQRFAGAAGAGRRAVTIEWGDVKELNPWRFGLASSLGIEVPDGLWNGAGKAYRYNAVMMPAVPLGRRAEAADAAALAGVISSSAMVDLYGQVHADREVRGPASQRSSFLREAYVAASPADRLKSIKALWSDRGRILYARQVLVAHAAARLPVNKDMAADAEPLIGSMLSAGLDRNALRWGPVVDQGSRAWGMLALAQPVRRNPVDAGSVEAFISEDNSEEQRSSAFLVAGLAGLGRLDKEALDQLTQTLEIDLSRKSRWSQTIDRAARLDNRALVALLAALGMQGEGWHRMTPRHLYHIVSALHRVGLDAEARMIAAEAIARS